MKSGSELWSKMKERLLKCWSHDLTKTKHQKVFWDFDRKKLSNWMDFGNGLQPALLKGLL